MRPEPGQGRPVVPFGQTEGLRDQLARLSRLRTRSVHGGEPLAQKGHVAAEKWAGKDVPTFEEYKVQFAAWCVWGAPLMLGCDIRSMDPEILKLVTNRTLLGIDQDRLALQPFVAETVQLDKDEPRVVARLLDGGDMALMFVNFGENEVSGRTHLDKLGLPYDSGMRLSLRDAFTGEVSQSGRDTISYRLAPRSCEVFRATPVIA